MRLSGDKGAFIAGEVDRQCGDFLGRCDAAHRLSRDELFAGFFVAAHLFAKGVQALFQRWALDRAGADAVAADALGNEVDGDRFGETNDGGFGGAVDEASGGADDRRAGRRHVDDRAISAFEHARKGRPDGAKHGLDVEVKGEVPFVVGGVQYGAVVDEARAVEKDIRLRVVDRCLDTCRVAGIDKAGFDVRVIRTRQIFKCRFADIGRNDVRTLVRHSDSTGAANALTGGCNQGALPRKPLTGHTKFLRS